MPSSDRVVKSVALVEFIAGVVLLIGTQFNPGAIGLETKQGNLSEGIDNKTITRYTLPTAEILSGKNVLAWVSMVLY